MFSEASCWGPVVPVCCPRLCLVNPPRQHSWRALALNNYFGRFSPATLQKKTFGKSWAFNPPPSATTLATWPWLLGHYCFEEMLFKRSMVKTPLPDDPRGHSLNSQHHKQMPKKDREKRAVTRLFRAKQTLCKYLKLKAVDESHKQVIKVSFLWGRPLCLEDHSMGNFWLRGQTHFWKTLTLELLVRYIKTLRLSRTGLIYWNGAPSDNYFVILNDLQYFLAYTHLEAKF